MLKLKKCSTEKKHPDNYAAPRGDTVAAERALKFERQSNWAKHTVCDLTAPCKKKKPVKNVGRMLELSLAEPRN
jgi:hypothetical protein